MKSQRRLRLRQVGRHHGDPRPWMWHHRVWNSRARALEMNVTPKHSKDEPPQAYCQINYVTGAFEWHGRITLNPPIIHDSIQYDSVVLG